MEHSPYRSIRGLTGINVHGPALFEIECAEFIDPCQMVHMLMCKQNGIDILSASSQKLLAQIRASIDQDGLGIRVDQYG